MTEWFESTENLSEIYIYVYFIGPVSLLVLKSDCLFTTKYCKTKTSHLSKWINSDYLFYHLFDKKTLDHHFLLYE